MQLGEPLTPEMQTFKKARAERMGVDLGWPHLCHGQDMVHIDRVGIDIPMIRDSIVEW